MEILSPTLTSVKYDFEKGFAECLVKYNVQGTIKSFDPIELNAIDVISQNTTGLILDSLEICRSMCQSILNIPVVLYK